MIAQTLSRTAHAHSGGFIPAGRPQLIRAPCQCRAEEARGFQDRWRPSDDEAHRNVGVQTPLDPTDSDNSSDMASGPASLPGPPASPPELTETHLLQSTAANLSFAADAVAGMPLPCPSWESGAEYFVCKAYNGEECTDSGDSAETGYLACRIGDCVTFMSLQ